MRRKNRLIVQLLSAAITGSTFALAVAPVAGIHAAEEGRWIQTGSDWMYQDADGSYLKDTIKTIGKTTYAFNEQGMMIKGWLEKDGKTYYFDHSGAMKKNWLKLGNLWYRFGDQGNMITGWTEDKNQWYFLDNKGVMKTGWLSAYDNWYYLDNSGAMKTGWLQLQDSWYCFNKHGGAMYTSSWLPAANGKEWYFVNDRGLWTRTSKTNPAKTEGAIVMSPDYSLIQNEPVKFYDLGWIVQVNDKYGLLSPEGTWVEEPVYEKVDMFWISAAMTNGKEESWVANFYPKADSYDGAFGYNKNGKTAPAMGFGGSTASFPVYVDGQVKILNYTGGTESTLSDDISAYQNRGVNYFVQNYPEITPLNMDNYWIWNPNENKVFGPYQWNEQPSFISLYDVPTNIMVTNPSVINYSFPGIFYETTSYGTRTLYSADTRESRGNYASIRILDADTAIGYRNDGSFDVLNGKCEVVYNSASVSSGKLSGGAGAIRGTALVKQDGLWGLLKLDK